MSENTTVSGLVETTVADECQCPQCIETKNASVFNRTFWDLWIQKIFRNVASMKFQWLLFLYIPTIWGMFHLGPENKPWISSVEGLAFLGGGFLTLATSRLLARTSLTESTNKKELDTEQ